jgi:hypothetical protein
MRALLKFCLCVALLVATSKGILTLGTSSQQPGADAATVTISVTGRANNGPQLTLSDMTLRVDEKLRAVISCERASSNQPLDLIILIDDALAKNRVNRWDEVQDFLRIQPAGVRETIAYAGGKAVTIAQAPTTDHALAANALVNPMTKSAPRTVLYESVQNLIDTWPAGSAHRVLIFVTPGFPRDYANTGIKPENSLPLQKLIEGAQRNGVVLYTIQSTTALANDPNPLTLLATETGGKAFVTGMEPGPSLQKFLQEIEHLIEQQYVVSFSVAPDAKSHFASLRVVPNSRAVELRYPARIYVTAK